MTNLYDLEDPRALVCALCARFEARGWCPAGSGGVTLRDGDRVYMPPTGIFRDALQPRDLFVFGLDGTIIEAPEDDSLSPSHTLPVMLRALDVSHAGAIIHLHSPNAVLATLGDKVEFHVTYQEMIKGIRGHHYNRELRVPIIDNQDREEALYGRVADALLAYKKSFAVLVRRHGLYVWGADWQEALRHAESYDYLFGIANQMIAMGIDPGKIPDL